MVGSQLFWCPTSLLVAFLLPRLVQKTSKLSSLQGSLLVYLDQHLSPILVAFLETYGPLSKEELQLLDMHLLSLEVLHLG